jgi:uncharacterized oligopeptide transporter (OPT) family protein
VFISLRSYDVRSLYISLWNHHELYYHHVNCKILKGVFRPFGLQILIVDMKLTYPSGLATAVLINGFHSRGDKMAKYIHEV